VYCMCNIILCTYYIFSTSDLTDVLFRARTCTRMYACMYIYYTYYTLYIFKWITYMYEDVCMYIYVLHILYIVYIIHITHQSCQMSDSEHIYLPGCMHVCICIRRVIHKYDISVIHMYACIMYKKCNT